MVHSEPPVPRHGPDLPPGHELGSELLGTGSCPQALLPPLHGGLNADRIKCPLLNADLCVFLLPQTSHSQHFKFRGVKQMNFPKAL